MPTSSLENSTSNTYISGIHIIPLHFHTTTADHQADNPTPTYGAPHELCDMGASNFRGRSTGLAVSVTVTGSIVKKSRQLESLG